VIVAHHKARKVIIGEKRPTAVPQITFGKKMTIELGGTVVELRYLGRSHSNNMIVMRFPKERILFAVDFIPVRTLAYRDFSDAYMPDWIRSLKRVERLDFDILAPGHGPLGKKEHVAMFRGYLEALRGEVLAHARAGRSLEDIKRLVTLERYKSWFWYEKMRLLNIEGMYRMVQSQRRGN
jgi:glyoxylase-like metal-dependent hydrolase (beta-lactamase superfamily II)